MILSPSPPTQPAQQLRSQSPAPGSDTTPSNPHVLSLKTIFPDFDETVILSVLESTNNDHDRALDVLLGMSDPSFVTSAPPQPPHQFQAIPSSDAQRLSQEALDEQLARRLALEEEQAASRTWQPQGAQAQPTYQSYQPRRGAQSQPQPQGPGGRDTMTEFQEGFSRIAESGKKTFTSIVSKVRAKMQEFDQGQGWSSSAAPPPSVPPNRPLTEAQGSYYQSYTPSGQQAPGQGSKQSPNSQWQTSKPLPVRGSSPTWSQSWKNAQSFPASSPPRSGVLRPSSTTEPAQSAGAQPSSYYDPNAQGYDLYGDEDEAPITLQDGHTPAAASAPSTTESNAPVSTGISSTQPPVSDKASVHSADPPSYKSRVSSPNAHSSLTPPTRSLSPTSAGSAVYVQTGASTTTGSTGRTGTSGSVDFSKLGLLPKRPISLVSPPASGGSGPAAPRMAPADSESSTDSTAHKQQEPEYVENPFEDR